MAMVVISSPLPPGGSVWVCVGQWSWLLIQDRRPSGFGTNDSYTDGGDLIFPLAESTTGTHEGSPHWDVWRHARIRGDRFSAASSMKPWTLATRSSGSGVTPSRIMALDQS